MNMKISLVIAVTLCFYTSLFAQGGLAMIDHSVVFKGNSRKEVTQFINRGSDTLRYSVSLVSQRMDRDGELVNNKDVVNKYEASPYLRIYPRTVAVPPGVLQSVAVQLRSSANMEPGEYRSHILFKPIFNDNNVEDISVDAPAGNNVNVEVELYTGVSIPVSILVEELVLDGEIDKLHIVKDGEGRALAMSIKRSGNRSLRAVLDFEYIPLKGESETIKSKSVVIYRELESLDLSFGISDMPATGSLRVTLRIPNGKGKEDDRILDVKEISL